MRGLKSFMKALPFGSSSSPSYTLEQLSTPKNARLDIVLIPSFASDQDKDWRWPNDLLDKLSEARVFTFKCDTDNIVSMDNVERFSRDVLRQLEKHRKDDRPIVFVTNGLGGSVCQKAVVLSNSSTSKGIRKICHSIKYIAFLDIPHKRLGDGFAIYIMVRRLPVPPNRAPGHVGEDLGHLQREFDNIIRKRKESESQYVTVSYVFEENPSAGTSKTDPVASVTSKENLRKDPTSHVDTARSVTRDDSSVIDVVKELERFIVGER
ncbi:hypothetical protein F5Y08DRAFT_31420 [Xylaria arbuscula]|nr:hypothetical protein F5Y08DRAFT_31420 [Xylaria arbuscula]